MRTPAPTRSFARLVVRRDYQAKWIWELLGEDRHVLNRSERNFATRDECDANALQNGHVPDRIPSKAATRPDL